MVEPSVLLPYPTQSLPGRHQHAQLIASKFYCHLFLDSLIVWPVARVPFPGKPFSYLMEAGASPGDQDAYANLKDLLDDGN